MKLNVQKYNPTADAAPYMVSGEIEYEGKGGEKMSVLQALVKFDGEVAPVNFEYACKERMCGRCGVMLDGVPCLACVTPIEDGEHTIAPLEGFPVFRDLIVDREALDDNITNTTNRIRIEDYTEEQVAGGFDFPADVREKMYAIESCCRCGVCNASCPAKQMYPDEYAGPAVMTALAYRHMDPFDQGDRVLEAVSKGLFRCIMCGQCDQNCAQQDIPHLELWQMLRDEAEARGIVPSYAK